MNLANSLRCAALVFVLAAAIATQVEAASGKYGIARGHLIFADDGKHRRLLIEPGTVLKILEEKFVRGRGWMMSVLTPTGIMGLMPKTDVEIVDKLPVPIAVAKSEFEPKSGIIVFPGEMFRYIQRQDGNDQIHEISIGKAQYNPATDKYKLGDITKVAVSFDDLWTNFNLLFEDTIEKTNFFEWSPLLDESDAQVLQRWGCGEEHTVKKSLVASVEGETTAEFGFWTWLKAKVTVKAAAERKETFVIAKKDPQNLHQLSFWVLRDEAKNIALTMVMDKIQPCSNSGAKYQLNYSFSFPNREFDDFKISHSWTQQWISRGRWTIKPTIVPLTLATLKDSLGFTKSLEDSQFFARTRKFQNHVRDHIIQYAAAVIKPTN